MQRCNRCAPSFIAVDLDVVTDGICRPEAYDGTCLDPTLGDETRQHLLRIGEEAASLCAHDIVVQDAWIASVELPGLEKRRPINVADQLRQVVGEEGLDAEELRLSDPGFLPVDGEGVGARGLQRDAALAGLAFEVGVAGLGVLGPNRLYVGLPVGFGEQARDDADRPAGVRYIDGLSPVVIGADLDGSMHAAGGCPTNQERYLEAGALHLGRHIAHLVERRRNEPRQAYDVGILLAGHVEDLLSRNHDAEVDHLVVIALQNHADDVLADIVHVALYGGHDDLALRRHLGHAGSALFGLEIGLEVGDGLLHHARRLHDLGQKHFASAEQVTDDVHPGHQRAFDNVQRLVSLGAGFLGIELDELGDAVHERVLQALLDDGVAPGEVDLTLLCTLALEALRRLEQAISRIGTAIQHDVLDQLAQVGRDIVVDGELSGVDDPHIHAGPDGMIKEHGVHRLAHGLVAAERERQVRDAT